MKRKATAPKSKIPNAARAWDPTEREAFRNGNRRRASTIQGKRRPAPTVKEWAA